MYYLRSALMLRQSKHSLARRKHPSIPRCDESLDEWTCSLSVCPMYVGVMTRSTRKTRSSCTVLTVYLGTGSMVRAT